MIRTSFRLGLAAALCAAGLVGQAPARADGSTGTAQAEARARAVPQRLQIPKLGTDAAVVRVPVRNDTLAVGDRLDNAVYTWSKGDPPCDPTGSTLYAGHAWRGGNGVADRWHTLRKGDRVSVGGCRFVVTSREYWPASRRMGALYSPHGPARIVLVGCKHDDYSKRVVVFARKVGR